MAAQTSESAVRSELSRMLKNASISQPRYGFYSLAAGTAKIRNISDVQGIDDFNSYRYPVLEGGGVSAGEGAVQYDAETYISAPRDIVSGWTGGRVPSSEEAYWTKVRGTSMEPWLPDGTPIFVSRCDEVLDGGRYVIYMDDSDAEVVKRIERLGAGAIRLISDNPSHSTRVLRHVEDDIYSDDELDLRFAIRIRGVVLYPTDTANAILQMISRHRG
jgi:SOS-response transcriptional repressor LexA